MKIIIINMNQREYNFIKNKSSIADSDEMARRNDPKDRANLRNRYV